MAIKRNIGDGDRIIRMVLAILFIISFFLKAIVGIAGWIFLVIGAVFLLTSLAGFCPLYSVLDCTTCNLENEEQ